MQKIKSVVFRNFKFFKGEFQIDFDGKNMLLFGENGSGKSSIYWGLYTFLQSSSKPDAAAIAKYFTPTNPENLVNIFAGPAEPSSISVQYEDVHLVTTTYEISLGVQNSLGNNTIKDANQASDFINYKLLSRLYDFSNSAIIDLFPIFEKELLTFIPLGVEFVPGNSNTSDWWKYLQAGLNPRPNMGTQQYRDFVHLLGVFNARFSAFLLRILEAANKYLQVDFKQKIKLLLHYEPATYDNFILNSTSKRDHKTTAPKIILSVDYLHNNLPGNKKNLPRPQTFLNEAKLTAIALSIRLAILDEKYVAQAPKLLVLDDLLISLDMSNRDIVLDLILEKYDQYQLLVMTHDPSFFSMIKRRIITGGKGDRWLIREMYHDESDATAPKPFMPVTGNYVDYARKYLFSFDYPASANYLRKEAERLLRYLLPEHKTLVIGRDGEIKSLQLDTLIENFRELYELHGGDFTPFVKLKEYKDFLLNPLSHDNIHSPVYRQELEATFTILEKLSTLDYKVLGRVDNESSAITLEELDNNNQQWLYEIALLENFHALRLLDGTWTLSDPVCLFQKRTNQAIGVSASINFKVRLVRGYSNIRYALHSPGVPRAIGDIVRNSDGQLINAIL